MILERSQGAGAYQRRIPQQGIPPLTRFLPLCLTAFALATALAPFSPAHAEDEAVRKPKTEFSGDLVVNRPGKKPVKLKIFYGTTHIRMDVSFLNRRLVTIVDKLKRETVLLLPHRREFMKVPTSRRGRAAIDRLIGVRGGLKKVGDEVIGGISATKYALTTKTAVGTTFKGHVWLTADNIMVRTAGSTPKGPVNIVLSNLRRGKVNPAMFVIPSGYKERKPGGKAARKPER